MLKLRRPSIITLLLWVSLVPISSWISTSTSSSTFKSGNAFIFVDSYTTVAILHHLSSPSYSSSRRRNWSKSPPLVLLNLFRSRRNRHSDSLNRIIEIESHIDWMELLEEASDEESNEEGDDPTTTKLVAVTFTAPWCRCCPKFLHRWNRKLVHRYYKNEVKRIKREEKMKKKGDNNVEDEEDCNRNDKKTTRVVPTFASVELNASTKKLCLSLNIQQLPTVQFYWKGELINSFPSYGGGGVSKGGISFARETLQRYLQMTSIDELEHEKMIWSIRSEAMSIQQEQKGSTSYFYSTTNTRRRPNVSSTDWKPMETLYLRKRDYLFKFNNNKRNRRIQ